MLLLDGALLTKKINKFIVIDIIMVDYDYCYYSWKRLKPGDKHIVYGRGFFPLVTPQTEHRKKMNEFKKENTGVS